MRIWLKHLRQRNKWTQAQIAEKLNISRQQYGFIETGERQADMNLSVACKISDIFNIPLSTIRNYEEGKYGDSND